MLTKTILAGIFASASICAVSAAELFTAKNMADFYKRSNVSFKENAFSAKGNFTLYGKKTFKIDPAKKYKLSMTVKCISGKGGTLYMGFKPLDAKNRWIQSQFVYNVRNTFTELASPAKKGDKVIKIKNAAQWNNKFAYNSVAFNAKADFSDLPNFDVVRSVKGSIVKKGDIWEITLSQPLAKAYPAGTGIRQHHDSSSFIYALFSTLKDKKEQKLSATVSGFLKDQISSYGKFWPGTRNVQPILMLLGADKNTVIEFKDFKLEEL